MSMNDLLNHRKLYFNQQGLVEMDQSKITLPVRHQSILSGKVRGLIICLTILFLSGCATQPKRSISPVINESAIIFQSGDFAVYEIPSRGAISDGMSISANGGRHAKNLSSAFASLSKSDNGNIVVYSTNPDLSYAAIKGAITEKQFPNIWLVYAGSKGNSELLLNLAGKSAMKYSFVDIVEGETE